jgi:hydrogenase maturation protease
MTDAPRKVLLIGFGNPGRLDDGLGPEAARRIEKLALPRVTVESDYQLTVEDAADIAAHDAVVFVDADTAGPEPFWVRRIQPGSSHVSFSTHSVEPRAVVALARDLFGREVEAYLVGIRGYEFNEFGEALSERATENLAQAVEYLGAALEKGTIHEIRAEQAEQSSAGNAKD